MARKQTSETENHPGFMVRWGAFKYGGDQVDPGQLLELSDNHEANERLLRLGYIAPFDGETSHTCAECGVQFATDQYRTEHGRFRHRRIGLTDEEIDVLEERQTERMNRMAPLHMDQTKATLGI